MLTDKRELRKVISTVIDIFKANADTKIEKLLRSSEISSEPTYHDNWNGGTTYYSIYITTSVNDFIEIQEKQKDVEEAIKQKVELVLRPFDGILLNQVYIIPNSIPKIEWDKIADMFTKDQMIAEVNYLKEIMISVSTGLCRINDINSEYQERYMRVNTAFDRLGLGNPNPFTDIWQWYVRWSSGELPQYKHRRAFIGEMYSGLLKTLEETEQPELLNVSVNLNGWERIDRSVKEIKVRLKQASTEEQFQAIGLLCRETIITLGQEIFKADKHPTLDGVKASKTDAKRMLDAYISAEIAGGSNENLRKYARSSSELANDLTHRRTATLKCRS